MATIRKTYKRVIVVDKPKLDRLRTVIVEKLKDSGKEIFERYEVRLSDGRHVESRSLSAVLDLPSSERSRIVHLSLRIGVVSLPEPTSDRHVEIEYDGSSEPEVTLNVDSSDDAWALHTFSVVEEQVERTLEKDFIYNLATTVGGSLLTILVLSAMWLSSKDLDYLEKAHPSPSTLTDQEIKEIVGRQVRNINQPKGPF